ncbi:MAG TPA: MFS transporter [Thermoleophilia bacterium]
MKKWAVIIVLALGQFVMVLDATVMNVSLSTVTKDLDTTIAMLQVAITLYTLVMAALMLVGGKLGDILGRRRVLVIGLLVYGLGSLITSLSPNVYVLMLGWSVVEGLGAVLVIPAIAALAAANYEGKARAVAFGILGGVAGAAAAAGPLIGGLVTTYLSWRFVFAAETVIVIGIVAVSRIIRDSERVGARQRLDLVGAILSAGGLTLIVFAVLQSSKWGWVIPKGALTLGGTRITPFGLSVVPFVIMAGGALLYAFAHWEARQETKGGAVLLQTSLLGIKRLRAGLSMLSVQQLVIAGVFFVIPVYLQTVLLKNALQTGLLIMPMSVGVIVFAMAGPRLASRFAPRSIVRAGLGLMLAASFLLMLTISPELRSAGFAVSLALLGSGIGLIVSQLGNVNLSSVDEAQTSEVGGLQGVFQNLGGSLGTALIGAILLMGLTSGFQERVLADPTIPANVQQQLVVHTKAGVQIVSKPQALKYLEDAGLPDAEAAAIAEHYSQAQLSALKQALLGVVVLTLISFVFTRHLPNDKPGEAAAGAETEAASERSA